MEVSGRLVSFPVSDLLNWAFNERRSGSLVLRRSSREKRIYFQDGKVVGCHSDTAAEFFGKHLLLEGYLGKDALARCLLICQEAPRRRLGAVLIEEGVLPRDVVRRTLTEHIEDMVCDVFLWQRGLFFFEQEPPRGEEALVTPIHALRLVLEGSRWVDEMRRIRRILAHDQVLLERVPGPGSEGLNSRASFVVRELGSVRTVASLYAVIGGSYFRFLEEIYRLVGRGLLRVVDQGQASASASADLPITELLMEQAVEEQRLVASHGLVVPLHLFESYYPARSREPDVEQRAGISAAESAFLERIDGKRPLYKILAKNYDERAAELEILLLLISKGLLAFIPPPPGRVGK